MIKIDKDIILRNEIFRLAYNNDPVFNRIVTILFNGVSEIEFLELILQVCNLNEENKRLLIEAHKLVPHKLL